MTVSRTHQEVITANLALTSQLIWRLCSRNHADVALNASREAMAAAMAMHNMFVRRHGVVQAADPLPQPKQPIHVRRKRQRPTTRSAHNPLATQRFNHG